VNGCWSQGSSPKLILYKFSVSGQEPTPHRVVRLCRTVRQGSMGTQPQYLRCLGSSRSRIRPLLDHALNRNPLKGPRCRLQPYPDAHASARAAMNVGSDGEGMLAYATPTEWILAALVCRSAYEKDPLRSTRQLTVAKNRLPLRMFPLRPPSLCPFTRGLQLAFGSARTDTWCSPSTGPPVE
jgi:hypothetical protein